MDTAALVAEGERKVPDDIGVARNGPLPYPTSELMHPGNSHLKVVKGNHPLHTCTSLSTCLKCNIMQQQLSGE